MCPKVKPETKVEKEVTVKRTIAAVLVAVLLTSGLLFGCGGLVRGSGNLDTQEMEFSGFTRIEASHGFEVEITQSDSYSVIITADDNLFDDHITVSKAGDTLKIRLCSNYLYTSVTLRAKVIMPALYKLGLSGGSTASISGFSSSHDFSAQLSGGSWVNGDIAAADADFDLSGGSTVTLTGSADDLVVKGSGGSQLDLEAFSVDNADINLSGGGRATVNLDGTLDVNLSGGSKVLYIGEPTLGDIDLSGDSTVSKK